jgi:hypothetical protein
VRLITLLVVSTSVQLYRWLIHLYPASFRRDYGEEMIQLFDDLCWDEMRQGDGFLGLLKLWFCVLTELRATTREQHLLAGSYYRFRRTLTRVLLATISTGFLLGGWLFLLNGGAQFLSR